jgi:hypothetical protein
VHRRRCEPEGSAYEIQPSNSGLPVADVERAQQHYRDALSVRTSESSAPFLRLSLPVAFRFRSPLAFSGSVFLTILGGYPLFVRAIA